MIYIAQELPEKEEAKGDSSHDVDAMAVSMALLGLRERADTVPVAEDRKVSEPSAVDDPEKETDDAEGWRIEV